MDVLITCSRVRRHGQRGTAVVDLALGFGRQGEGVLCDVTTGGSDTDKIT